MEARFVKVGQRVNRIHFVVFATTVSVFAHVFFLGFVLRCAGRFLRFTGSGPAFSIAGRRGRFWCLRGIHMSDCYQERERNGKMSERFKAVK